MKIKIIYFSLNKNRCFFGRYQTSIRRWSTAMFFPDYLNSAFGNLCIWNGTLGSLFQKNHKGIIFSFLITCIDNMCKYVSGTPPNRLSLFSFQFYYLFNKTAVSANCFSYTLLEISRIIFLILDFFRILKTTPMFLHERLASLSYIFFQAVALLLY